ncbi:hypothetical protein BDV23DRAFT_62922 [Aspergillus alliaceus]|uniref:Uncharacterized protein n=1 Tax=Petromyces alliaceus TaxID=209559 RepID=A0A5N7CEK1_PETAA|nr:uncharacterized protein BDW43DRAFT_221746 [Aspergillus alliaceus]KAB8228199.1 hypothetical protein BDW43DRAFT_221746 [Aspergillus alliaceus]KAE8391963.1 hypothetical protein BDV23DRAFT_62922 [Aspergillus alliaceus]
MSSQGGPKKPNDGKQEGFSKYLHRMRMVLRKGSASRAESVSDLQETTSGGSEPANPKAAAPTKIPAAVPKINPAPAKETVAHHAIEPTVFKHWGAIQEEKARALFAKYGLTLEPGEWKSPTDVSVQRVAKPIRMRVRRTCHRCQTTFGPDKLCTNCQHVRCKKCPRYPAAKSHDHTETALQTILSQKGKEPAGVQRKAKEPPLTIPSRTGGQDLVHKQTKQRVRRTCHRCCTTFEAGATECLSCKHTRCKKCPREPAKLHKYPDGYPGDAEPPVEPPARTWRKARQRVRYTCHQCSTLYQSGQKICSNCGQEKGPQTIRDPPKKRKPEPDPEVVRRVEERLARATTSVG